MESVDTLTTNTATPHVEAICACLDRLGGTLARLPPQPAGGAKA